MWIALFLLALAAIAIGFYVISADSSFAIGSFFFGLVVLVFGTMLLLSDMNHPRHDETCSKAVLDKLPLMIIPERSWLYNEGQWCRIR